MNIFLLEHSYEYGDAFEHNETKIIGVYSNEEMAQNAIERLKKVSGFNKHPIGCFHIDKYTLDEDNWTEGFIKSDEAAREFEILTECFNKWLNLDSEVATSWENDNYYNALCEVNEKVYKVNDVQELANHIHLVWSVRFESTTPDIEECLVVAKEVINSLKLR